MLKFKSKEEILKLYVKRYDELDKYALEQLGKEYDHFMDLIKDCNSKDEVMEVFEKEIEINETRFRKNAHAAGIESSPCQDFYSLLAAYGMIVFFRDNILE